MLLEELRRLVIKTAVNARRTGLVNLTFGNFSAREKETGMFCITPSGMDYDTLLPEDIVVLDAKGKVADGTRKPSVETPLHCLTYQKRPNVYGLCHTHSVYATSWACGKEPLPIVVAELAALVGKDRVAVTPYRPMGSEELARVTVDTLAEQDVVLMANHGLLAVGPDLQTAFTNALVPRRAPRLPILQKLWAG